jgi:hypothetical protein
MAIAGILHFTFSSTSGSSAENDDILTEIAGYRSWTKINKEPIKVITSSPLGKKAEVEIEAFSLAGEGG